MSERDLTTSRSVVFGHVEKGTVCRICERDECGREYIEAVKQVAVVQPYDAATVEGYIDPDPADGCEGERGWIYVHEWGAE